MNSANNIDAALRLAAAGIPIFPADPETKRPFVRFTSAATNKERGVRYFWSRYGASALPAIHLTGCGLVVVDLDRGHGDGADGIASFDLILDQYGELPSCPTVRTPRGGAHLYMKQPAAREPIGNSTGHIAPGVDIRGYHGLSIAPGAVMTDGEFYEAITGTSDLCAAFASGSIPELPAWLIELAERRPALPERVPLSLECDDRRGREWAVAALEGEARDLARTEVGKRNHKLNSAVYRLAGMAARSWLTETEIWDATLSACSANGYLGSKDSSDGPVRFKTTFISAFRSGFAKPAVGPQERLAPVHTITLRSGVRE